MTAGHKEQKNILRSIFYEMSDIKISFCVGFFSLVFVSNNGGSYQRRVQPDGQHKGGRLGEEHQQQAGHICGLSKGGPAELLQSGGQR